MAVRMDMKDHLRVVVSKVLSINERCPKSRQNIKD